MPMPSNEGPCFFHKEMITKLRSSVIMKSPPSEPQSVTTKLHSKYFKIKGFLVQINCDSVTSYFREK